MIDSFTGSFGFLSNFFPSTVKLDGKEYPTVEHAYQAAKTKNIKEREEIRSASSPGTAKRLGRKVKLRSDWEEIKLDIMRKLLRKKFKKDPLRKLLLETGNQELIEGNWWGDTFWGVCKGKGDNNLGKLLMKIRSEIRNN